MKFYTGIGSRETPKDVLDLLTPLAVRLRDEGWTLRSGHAAGADRAFEIGAQEKSIIYLPWHGFGQRQYGDDFGMPVLGTGILAQTEHLLANYQHLVKLGIRDQNLPKQAVQLLHGRNLYQVMGHEQPAVLSKFVVCWCPEDEHGEPMGGTATAVKLARHLGIPVFNLWRPCDRFRIEHKLKPSTQETT